MQDFMVFAKQHWLLFTLFVVILIIWLVIESRISLQKNQAIGIQKAITMMNQDKALLIDVRKVEKFETGHILGAMSLPADDFSTDNKIFTKRKQRPILIYADTTQLAINCAMKLKKSGIEEVFVISGGITAWKQANMPVVKGV